MRYSPRDESASVASLSMQSGDSTSDPGTASSQPWPAGSRLAADGRAQHPSRPSQPPLTGVQQLRRAGFAACEQPRPGPITRSRVLNPFFRQRTVICLTPSNHPLADSSLHDHHSTLSQLHDFVADTSSRIPFKSLRPRLPITIRSASTLRACSMIPVTGWPAAIEVH